MLEICANKTQAAGEPRLALRIASSVCGLVHQCTPASQRGTWAGTEVSGFSAHHFNGNGTMAFLWAAISIGDRTPYLSFPATLIRVSPLSGRARKEQ